MIFIKYKTIIVLKLFHNTGSQDIQKCIQSELLNSFQTTSFLQLYIHGICYEIVDKKKLMYIHTYINVFNKIVLIICLVIF